MVHTLLKDNNCNGKFIALKNFKDHTVIGEGETPQQAYDEALGKGCKDPVLTFVPAKDMVQIY